MLLSFAVLFGMRYDVGQDHLAYLDGYINPFLHKEYEPLFALIRDTLSRCTSNRFFCGLCIHSSVLSFLFYERL